MPELAHSEFERQLKGERLLLPPVIAITGGEDFIRADTIAILRAHLESKGYTIERFDDIEGSPEELIRNLRTPSLFGTRQAVLIRSVRRGNRQEAIVRFKDQLLEYFERPARSNLLIFDGETWNGSMAVPRKIKSDFLTVECPSFKPWQRAEIAQFIETRARRQSLTLASGVADELRDACAGGLALIERELEKLALVIQGRPVTSKDLAAHIKYHGDEDVFALCDAIIEGKRARAVELATKVVRNSDPGPILQFLGLLETQVRKLARLAHLVRARTSPATALAQSGFNPRSHKANTLVELARRMPEGGFAAQFQAMLEADMQLKSGAPDPAAIVFGLIHRLGAISSVSAAKPQR